MRTEYTLEDIRNRRKKLSQKIRTQEEKIEGHWEDLTARPDLDSPFEVWMNRGHAAYSLYDGFMTGFKLCKPFFGLFKKRKKATQQKGED